MNKQFDVIIIGGSYAGLSAAMALGRALRDVLIIDSGKPANRFTPHSHNFITHDGRPPGEIAAMARDQLKSYASVRQVNGLVVRASGEVQGFAVEMDTGAQYHSRKLIFASGIVDLLPAIPGVNESWGKSVLHCPYCHGYEVRNVATGILGNGDYAFEFGMLISNWTKDLTVFTNGFSTLTPEQQSKLLSHHIRVVEDKVLALRHDQGYLSHIELEGGTTKSVTALYTRPGFKHGCDVPLQLGCELTEDGYIRVDPAQKTSVPGIYACGDNVTKVRTVANAVAMGTTAGMMANKELVVEDF